MDNKILTSLSKNITAGKIPQFDIQKTVYSQFVSKMDKSDLSNSFTRYTTELELLKKLKNTAQSNNLKAELEKIAEREKYIKSKLEELGYRLD